MPELYLRFKGFFRACAPDFRYFWREKLSSLPKVIPFLAIVAEIMIVLSGGSG